MAVSEQLITWNIEGSVVFQCTVLSR